MPDREKVIKGLREMSCRATWKDIDRIRHKFQPIINDAIAMLKEQEAVMPKVSSVEQRCGNCNKIIEMDGWKACPWCGKPIAWNEWWKKNGGQAVKWDD